MLHRSPNMLGDIEEFFQGEKENRSSLDLLEKCGAESTEQTSVCIEHSIDLEDNGQSAAEIFKSLVLGRKPSKRVSNGVCISAPDLSREKVRFIRETSALVSAKTGVPIVFDPENVEACTHLVLETDQKKRCRKSRHFVLGILLGKRIVCFNWYLDVLEEIATLSLETITLLNLVQGDAEGSDVAELVYMYGVSPEGFFSGINIQGPLPGYVKRIVHALGGTTQKSIKHLSIPVDSDEMFYSLITKGSKSPWASLLFPRRMFAP
ncbi:hypothetical protein NECID01_0491 [Nematocida sp. AWRm77]|nr:hypothetical protein NECID01_0491 [Nematocida sp. AWRm77]